MTHSKFTTRSRVRFLSLNAIGLCIAGLLSATAIAYCDEPLSMAPPVQGDSSAPQAASSSVFNWQEIPENQNVSIQRAVFDRGGYQLFDTVGETIVVPFTNDNLYVMKFAVSSDGSTYFVNTGTTPVLYLPEDGYLENAAADNAHWYPFTREWHPETPVFIGIAPSWHDYLEMGWYPGMVCYGGYWCGGPFVSVGAVFPTFGLFFQIGGAHYGGWGSYWNYCSFHPAPYRVTIVNQNVYNYGGAGWQHWAYNHPFYGSGRPYLYGRGFVSGAVAHNFAAHQTTGRIFNGAGRPYEVGHGFVGQSAGYRGTAPMAHEAFHSQAYAGSGSNHAFRGAEASNSGTRSFGSNRSNGGSHEFRGASAGRSFSTSHSFSGSSGSHTYTASHSFRGASDDHSASAGHSFQGGLAGRSFQGGSAGRSFGGSQGSDSHSWQGGHGGPSNHSQGNR